jgi:hypothetical protein
MQPLRLLRRIAFASLALGILVPPLCAESFEARHARDLASNPADLHFRLDTTGEKRAFHIGERIPIELQFSSDSPQKYKLDNATGDSSGRLQSEEFVLEQEDVVDPYQDYFGSGVFAFVVGGPRGISLLTPNPIKVEFDLNDLRRFDRPGRYRLYLKSHRLTDARPPGEMTVEFAAVSNILELEILADDAAWEAAKLGEIRAVLDQPEPARPTSGPIKPLIEKIALARRELRYLGTVDAVQLSLDYARRTRSEPDAMLLFGARDRPRAIQAFDGYLADRRVPIRRTDILIRALFTLLQRDAPKPLPDFSWQYTDGYNSPSLRQTRQERLNRFGEFLRAEAIRLAPLVAGKDAEAREVSLETIAHP